MILHPSSAALPLARACALLAAAALLPVAARDAAAQPIPAAAAGTVSSESEAARAEQLPIVEGDVLTLRVVTWNLLENRPEDWLGAGGDVTVQDDGTIMVPFAGTVHAAGRTSGEIAGEVSAALRAATGVQSAPSVIVEIAQRRPIYVSGDVMNPGAIDFRAGLTARQAIALAGGPLRVLPGSGTDLLARQAQIREAILRADLRIARLEAELEGAERFEVPEGMGEEAALEELVAVEERLMEARRTALAAQTASVDELISVLTGVRQGLEEQIGLVEEDVRRAEEDLLRRQELLDRGLTPASAVSETETRLSSQRMRLVDITTQLLNLEKDLSEARRARDMLRQTREIEILRELGEVRDRRRDLELDTALASPGLDTLSGEAAIGILLIEAGGLAQVRVEPETRLRPGDTLILETSAE